MRQAKTFVRRHAARLTALLLVLTTLLVYWQVVQFDFVNYDDGDYVTDNPVVKGGLTWHGVTWAFTAFHRANWHPLTWLSHMLDVQLFGMDPGAHHLVNVALHVVNTLLLFLALRVMTGTLWRSAAVAALFALHPLHVESVAWIAERKDVLSTLFWMGTLLFYQRYVKSPSIGRYIPVFIAMALGVMSKPMVVTLPFVLLLLDFWPLRRAETERLRSALTIPSLRATWPLVREKLPLFALTVFSCVMTFKAQTSGGAVASIEFLDASTRLANAVLAYGMYLVKTLWPAGLAVLYPYPQHFPWLASGLAATVVAGFSYAAVRLRGRHPWLTVGWFWYLGTLVPVIGLVQVGSQSMADRYTYLPLIGIFVILAWGVADLLARMRRPKVWALVLACAVLPAMTVATALQLRHWRDSTALFNRALAVAEDNLVARNNLGQALAVEGRMEEAIEQFEAALGFGVDQGAVHLNLGTAYLQNDLPQLALQQFQLGIRFYPRAGRPHELTGMAYERLGDAESAIRHYQQALHLDPGLSKARYNLATLYYNAGWFEQAIETYRQVLDTNPQSVETFNSLGLCYEKLGARDWAIKYYQQAIRINPDFAPAHGNIGVAYYRAGDMDKAISHLQEAVALDPEYHLARENLGKALAAKKEK